MELKGFVGGIVSPSASRKRRLLRLLFLSEIPTTTKFGGIVEQQTSMCGTYRRHFSSGSS